MQQAVQSENPTADTQPDYVIYVNRALNCVTVMQKEAGGVLTPVKSCCISSCPSAFTVKTPAEHNSIPRHTIYKMSRYYEWRLMVDNTYGRYAVSFNGKILFHSVPYLETSPDSLELHGEFSGIVTASGFPSGNVSSLSEYTMTVVPALQLSKIHFASSTDSLTQPSDAFSPSFGHYLTYGISEGRIATR